MIKHGSVVPSLLTRQCPRRSSDRVDLKILNPTRGSVSVEKREVGPFGGRSVDIQEIRCDDGDTIETIKGRNRNLFNGGVQNQGSRCFIPI